MTMCGGFFQVSLGTLSLILNAYFICCIVGLTDLRKLQFVPLAWQAFCDIIAVSIFSNSYGIKQLFPVAYEPGHEEMTSQQYWYCIGLKLSLLLNEYSTGPVLLLFAVERFILVVLPFRAKSILSTKYYIVSSVAVIAFGAILSVVGSFEFFHEPIDCPRIGNLSSTSSQNLFL